MKIRLIPFVTWAKHDALQKQLASLQACVNSLQAAVTQHQDATHRQFRVLKSPPPRVSTLQEPLTPEQEEILKEYNENNRLPGEIRRSFASGGSVGMRAALGRFGEAPSEQTRRADDVHPVQPGDVSVTVKIMGDTDLDDLIREDNAQRDREAWENQELTDYLAQPPKE